MNRILLIIFCVLSVSTAIFFPVHAALVVKPDNKRHGVVQTINTIYAGLACLWPAMIVVLHVLFKEKLTYYSLILLLPSLLFFLQIQHKANPKKKRIENSSNRIMTNTAIISIISGAVLALSTCLGGLHKGRGSKFIITSVIGAFISSFLIIQPRENNLNKITIQNEVFTMILTMLFSLFIYGVIIKGVVGQT